MKKIFVLSIMAIVITSCSPLTSNFIRTSDVSWSTVQLRENIDFDEAWNQVIDVLAKQFEMEMISKEGAYARTGWIYTWNTKGVYSNKYRNRVIIKFSPDRTQVEIKTEAQFNAGGIGITGANSGKWQNGFDSRLLQTVKQDIMGVVGRTTR